MNDEIQKEGGFERIDEWKPVCLSSEHQPPKHIVIPPGQQFRHVCPRCGDTVILRGPFK